MIVGEHWLGRIIHPVSIDNEFITKHIINIIWQTYFSAPDFIYRWDRHKVEIKVLLGSLISYATSTLFRFLKM